MELQTIKSGECEISLKCYHVESSQLGLLKIRNSKGMVTFREIENEQNSISKVRNLIKAIKWLSDSEKKHLLEIFDKNIKLK